MDVYRAGRVGLANAPGTGMADDKVVYAFIPKIVKYYLDQDIIIPNVPTFMCAGRDASANMCWRISTSSSSKRRTNRAATACWSARTSTAAQHEEFAVKIQANPRNYIAQPTLVALARADDWWTSILKGGTWTCVRTFFMASRSTCCPAA